MNLKAYSSQILPAVEQELQNVVRQALRPECAVLRDMLTYHMGWEGPGAGPEAQGKRIRPLLLLLCAAAVDESGWQPALPAAASVELIHNFSLIHDDIQDRSELRRGRPTLWTRWGQAQAINAGDTMFSLAQLSMLNLSRALPAEVALQASQILNQTCVSLTEGQYLDLSYEGRADLGLQDYWPMVTGKTAALLEACTRIGALAGGADTAQQQAFGEFGKNLGLAFQVMDDLLGIWGDAHTIGKSNESDLVSGKKTLPVLYALSQQGDFAARWKSGPITPAEVPQVVRLLEQSGANDYAKQQADALTARALQSLQSAFRQPNLASAALSDLADKLLSRQA